MSTAVSIKAKKPLWRRALMMAVMVPLIIAAVFVTTHAYLIYSHNRDADQERFPSAAPLAIGQSILIISPHPDDETLGAAGLIQDAIRNHIPVHVVFMTDGDAFRVGVSGYYHILHVTPADYVKYGVLREQEARNALATLCLPAQDVTFLGYPDQGTLPIWRSHWLVSDPFLSLFTKVSSVPYPDAYRRGAPYCGQSIVQDLDSLIQQYRPTDIYTTHPSDDHPDHLSASAFLNAALTQLTLNGQTWASNVHVHFFLVHRGDWPVPQGLNQDETLAPPAPMLSLDTHWRSLTLAPGDTQRKKDALYRYVSQQELMRRFLTSFVRKNELFGTIPDSGDQIPIVASGQIELDGDTRDWPTEAPLASDAAEDTVIRDFQSGADLRYIYVCADQHNLYARIDCENTLSPQIHYNLYLRAFDAHGGTRDSGMQVSFTPRNLSPGSVSTLDHGVRAAYDNQTLELSIPLSDLSAHRPAQIYVEATTMFTHVIVDRTGIRCGILPDMPVSKPLT